MKPILTRGLLLLLLTIPMLAQLQNSVLIYTDDTPYLMPFVESEMKSLTDARTKAPLFAEVTNLARLLENLQDEQTADDIRLLLSDGALLSVREGGDMGRQELLRLFSNYDYFLKVNINPLVELIEYQFTVYEILPAAAPDAPASYERMVLDLYHPLNSISVFVDPRSPDHQRTLALRIRSLFPVANQPPVVAYTHNGSDQKDMGAIFVCVTDTLVLDAGASTDPDHREEELRYTWTQLSSDSSLSINPKEVNLRTPEKVQRIVFPEAGVYSFQLTVSDGLSTVKSLPILVGVVEKPLIYLPNKKQVIYDFTQNWTSNNTYDLELPFRSWTYPARKLNLNLQRITPTKLEGYNKDVVEIYSAVGSLFAESVVQNFSFPDVLTCDTVHVGDRNDLKLKMQLRPTDYPKGGKYEYAVNADFYGIPANTEEFNISYISIDGLLEINAQSFNHVGGATAPFAGSGFGRNDFPFPENYTAADTFRQFWFTELGRSTINYSFFTGAFTTIKVGLGLNKFRIGTAKTQVLTGFAIPEGDTLLIYRETGYRAPRLAPSFQVGVRPFRRIAKSSGVYANVFAGVHLLLGEYQNTAYYVPPNSSNPQLLSSIGESYVLDQSDPAYLRISAMLDFGIDVYFPIYQAIGVGKKVFGKLGMGGTYFEKGLFFNFAVAVVYALP